MDPDVNLVVIIWLIKICDYLIRVAFAKLAIIIQYFNF